MTDVETTTAESVLASVQEEANTDETQLAENTEETEQGTDGTTAEAAPAKPRRAIQIQARQERALRKKEAEVNAKLEQVTAWEAASGNAKQDPLAYLEQSGIDLDYLADFLLNGEAPAEAEPDPLQVLTEEVNAMKMEKAEKELASVRQEQTETLSAFKAEVTAFVADSEEKYPLSHSFEGAADQVNELIVEYFEESGDLLTLDEATSLVEDELNALAVKLGLSVTQSEREASRDNEGDEHTQAIEKIRSLTNQMQSQAPTPEEDDSDEAAHARAVALIRELHAKN